MSIQEHLNKIRNAVYGHEVRESIAKGIETAYDDASENGNANMEVKIARGTHPNLRSRLEEVDNKQQQTTAQLAQKVGGGKLASLNDFDEETLNFIQDGTGGPISVESIPKDKSVTERKTTFLTNGKNLFTGKYYPLGVGYYSNNNALNYIKSTDSNVGIVVPLEPNETYTIQIHERKQGDYFSLGISNSEVDVETHVLKPLDTEVLRQSNSIKKVTFTNTSEGKFLVGQVSNKGENYPIQVERGNEPTPYEEPYTIDKNLVSAHLDNAIERLSEVLTNKNLLDYEQGTIATSGEEGQSTTIWRSDYVTVNKEYDYVYGSHGFANASGVYSLRFAYYDEFYNVIEVTDYVTHNVDETYRLEVPEKTGYVRFVSDVSAPYMFLNLGSVPYYEGLKTYNSGVEEIIPDETIRESKLSQDLQLKINKVTLEKPFPKKPKLEILDADTHKSISHLSSDGKVIYAADVSRVEQSMDEGETWETVLYSPNGRSVNAIRTLDDGELIFSTVAYETEKSKLFKTSGYSVNDLSSVDAYEVLSADNTGGNFNDAWGLDVHHNIVVASEYGTQNQATHVYFSDDFGETFSLVFDQKTDVKNIPGSPTYTDRGHVHTVHYDRYWERIWVAVGDHTNTAVYYSDDHGTSWRVVKDSTGTSVIQYTGIMSYPEGVFFGSDRTPDGVYFYDRKQGKHSGTIELLYEYNRVEDLRTLVFLKGFRRYAKKDEVTYFTASRDTVVQGEYGSTITAFKSNRGGETIFDATVDLPNYLDNIHSCVGDTVGGNIIFSVSKIDGGGKGAIVRAKAPFWE